MDSTALIILGVCVALLILFKFLSLRGESKLESQGKIVRREKGFNENAEIFTMGPIDQNKVTEGLKEIGNTMRISINGNTNTQSFSITGGSWSQWSARLKLLEATEEKTVYRFLFSNWKSGAHSTAPEDPTSMNLVLTAVEKMFLNIDPNTKVHTEPVSYHTEKS